MNKTTEYNPVKYFLLVMLSTYLVGLFAIYLSYQEDVAWVAILLLLFGIFIPAIYSIIFLVRSENKELLSDFKSRFFRLNDLNVSKGLIILLTVPLSTLLAILISIPLGGSPEQLQLTSTFDIVAGGVLISLLIPFLAASGEEIGWRGYAVDSLLSKFNLFNTTLIFASIWAMWHLPLFFVKGYYQNQLLETDPILALNFFLSVFVIAFIMNWLYVKCNRSIILLIVFHFITVMSAEIFMINEYTKIIQTFLLAAFALVLVVYDKKLFFGETIQFRKLAESKNVSIS